tara:strand:- start:844 stop:996 length:153 start_codon:yes stop_codon:yes gene_type:complete
VKTYIIESEPTREEWIRAQIDALYEENDANEDEIRWNLDRIAKLEEELDD